LPVSDGSARHLQLRGDHLRPELESLRGLCFDQDECATVNRALVHGTCTNLPGSFVVTCDPGFEQIRQLLRHRRVRDPDRRARRL
jgi:hypothetical protein